MTGSVLRRRVLDILSETPDPYFPFFQRYELNHRRTHRWRRSTRV